MWFVQLSDDELLAAGACLSFHTGEGDSLSALEADRPKACAESEDAGAKLPASIALTSLVQRLCFFTLTLGWQ